MSEDLTKLSCKEAARLMSQQRDRELNSGEAEALKQHLFQCLNCLRFERQIDFLGRLARLYGTGGGGASTPKPVDD